MFNSYVTMLNYQRVLLLYLLYCCYTQSEHSLSNSFLASQCIEVLGIRNSDFLHTQTLGLNAKVRKFQWLGGSAWEPMAATKGTNDPKTWMFPELTGSKCWLSSCQVVGNSLSSWWLRGWVYLPSENLCAIGISGRSQSYTLYTTIETKHPYS